MWPRTYFARAFWTSAYWPPDTNYPPIPPTPPTTGALLQVGGDGISHLTGTTFVTLTMSFTFGVSMRTE